MSNLWNTCITNNAQPIRLGVCVSLIDAVAAAAKAVAATVEKIGGAIAAGGWVVWVIIAVIIVIFVMIMAVIGHWEFTSPLVALETLHPS